MPEPDDYAAIADVRLPKRRPAVPPHANAYEELRALFPPALLERTVIRDLDDREAVAKALNGLLRRAPRFAAEAAICGPIHAAGPARSAC